MPAHRRRLVRALVAGVLVGAVVAPAAPASAATDSGLTVSLDGACDWLLAGERTALRLLVRNDTGERLDAVSLLPRLPAGVTATVTRRAAPVLAGQHTAFDVALDTAADGPAGQTVPLAFDVVAGGRTETFTVDRYVGSRPVAPANVAATAGDGTATVTWVAGAPRAYPAGPDSARRVFVVTASPGGARTTVFGATTATVAGLDNGTAYTFTVTEWNHFGETTSAPSTAVTPVGVPDAVTGVTVAGTGATRVVSWTAPDANGAPLTGYTVTAYPGGATVAAPADATSAQVTGLAPDVQYSFTVRATNAAGDGPESALPGAGPDAEYRVEGHDDSATVSVSFDPASPPAVDGWLVTFQPGGVELFAPRDHPYVTPGGTYVETAYLPGTTVVATVRPLSGRTVGPATTLPPVVVRGDPEPPVVTGWVPRESSAEVCLLAGWDRGGELSGYEVAWDRGAAHLPVTARTTTVPDLDQYGGWFEVWPSPRPASPAVTQAWVRAEPVALPPTGVFGGPLGKRQIRLGWDEVGQREGHVEIVATPGGHTAYVPWDADPHVYFDDLDGGTEYTFTLRRVTRNGYSEPTVFTAIAGDVPGAVPDVTVRPAPDDPWVLVVTWGSAPPKSADMQYYAARYVGAEDPFAWSEHPYREARTDQLEPGRTYRIAVWAFNEFGAGPETLSDPYTMPGDPVAPPVDEPPVVTAPTAFTTGDSARVGFTAPYAVAYDVRYRVARYDGGFGAYRYPAAWQGTAETSVGRVPRAGWTYCFSVRARRTDGRLTTWSDDACTAAPIDDASLAASPRWTRGLSSRHYAGTYTATTTAGATLTRTNVRARRLALVATRCPTCGDVGVYLNGTLVKRVRLTAPVRSWRNVVTVDLGALRTGTVTVRAVNGRAYVDGLGVLPV